ncbi:MAG TPA: hypothetical protein DCQ31_17595, partial [Bacteroidales bacterium]|nr:hypothetical protein [Bacteroidales bacterium]
EFFESRKINNQDFYIAYAPFSIGKGTIPWTVGVAIPYEAIYKEANSNLYLAIGIGLAGIFIVSVIVYIIALQISRPIVQTTSILKEIEKGKIPRVKHIRIKGRDEIAEMGRSVLTLIDTLHQTVSFAEAISQNKFDTKYKLLSDEDALGNALLNMQTNLKIAEHEREKREKQELRERWETSGYAEFAEILRLNANNLNALAFSTISAIAAKLEAPAGAIYIVNEDNPEKRFIECIATYGYEKDTENENRIEIGEGMIGSCVMEKEMINVTNLPENYFKISSFSGKSIPSSVLVVPLILGHKVWGAMEIAGFRTFESFKITFVQKISENIASAIYAQRNSEKTVYLLNEANIQAEKIMEKERILREHTAEMELLRAETEKQKAELEKMRSAIAVREFELQQKTKLADQKEEEIEATMRNLSIAQKTTENQNREIEMLTSAIDKALMRAVYGIDGRIIDINERFCEITGFTKEQLIDKHLSYILDTEDDSFAKVWNDVKLGIPFSGKLFRKLKNGVKRTFLITYTPVFDEKNSVTQVYYLGYPLD